ncbi:hypothetical protein BU24DRAFT_36131 [Aaosphaeria arxii CBS 175.79]|uniref:Uncharacterized protein n=1 Tax=Aaosphaeria arxii CBS 175.79 TaxID=1450172 RepID=A0A6A5YBQ1_9PLEO|nr:uncharacterized protein BU24DRAFT_36131 [Aaosphaeria arxii CBS 175.79]KAF2022034.1 hypothetical protein BU24DRAFT_36131 [Aaosphaeria arxii CBS 175.79]
MSLLNRGADLSVRDIGCTCGHHSPVYRRPRVRAWIRRKKYQENQDSRADKDIKFSNLKKGDGRKIEDLKGNLSSHPKPRQHPNRNEIRTKTKSNRDQDQNQPRRNVGRPQGTRTSTTSTLTFLCQEPNQPSPTRQNNPTNDLSTRPEHTPWTDTPTTH